jgi:hypothetical protein
MRRRLQNCLPIAALALLAQLLTPLGALRAAVAAPAAMATICSGSSDPSQRHGAPAKAIDGHCGGFCCAGPVEGLTAAPAPLDVTSLQRQYQRTVWHPAPAALAALRPGSNAQARAPPLPIA